MTQRTKEYLLKDNIATPALETNEANDLAFSSIDRCI